MFEKLKILLAEYLLSMRVLQLDPGTVKGVKFTLFLEDPCGSLAWWMNEYLVVEFCIFPTKVNHILTLGVTMEILSVR